MPELPEVETIRRSLEPLVRDRVIESVEIHYGGIIKCPEPEIFARLLQNKTIRGIGRRGKYLLFTLSDNYTLIIHLRMTGRLTVAVPGAEPLAKHTHLVFSLSDGRELRFTDQRKFGLVYLVKTGDWSGIKGLCGLGPEPLEEGFTLAGLEEMAKKVKGGLKSFLLNQKRIAGIGNIYADEILFEAGLHPQRRLESLSRDEVGRLYRAIRRKLAEGIEYRGTSFRDYVDGKGEKGGFQEKLQVYDRANEPCVRCGRRLVRIVAAGRGTVFCPHCQR